MKPERARMLRIRVSDVLDYPPDCAVDSVPACAELFSDGQRRPSGDPEGRTMVARWGQRLGRTLHAAEHDRDLRQRHLLSGLDTPSDEGNNSSPIF